MFQWRTCFYERNLPMVGEFPGRQRCYQKKPGKLQRLEKNLKTLKLKVRWFFWGGDPSPCHFLTYVLQESDIFNGLLVGCGFGVPLHPFTNIHFSLACWDRHALKVNLLYFHAHWIVYFMYLYLHTQYSFCSQKYRFFPQAFGWKYDII